MTIYKAMEAATNTKLTENGAIALSSTLDKTLDFFGVMGAMRYRNDCDIVEMFSDAFGEDPKTALKMAFYLRDCRGGLGERRAFKTILKYLADNHTVEIKRNIELIPEYGRWDDLYAFMDTKLEAYAFSVMRSQFLADLEALKTGEEVSVLAKWLKSANSKNKETRALGLKTAKAFGMTERDYRKNLSKLREKIDVTERKMSANEWDKINYEGVPSICHNRVRGAFIRHDAERYQKFLAAVEAGEKTIKAATLFPYDIVEKYTGGNWYNEPEYDKTLELQWQALPEYATDKNFLIMADVSGSMWGRPMATAVGLAAYFATRTKSEFRNKFMTFSSSPTLVSIPERLNLNEKIKRIASADWGGSTNLERAFGLVLKSAVKANMSQEEMPDAIVVITDMELDEYSSDFSNNFTEEMSKRFKSCGYKMPTLVWWNVNARSNTFHATSSDDVRFVSGSSPSVFRDLCENMGSTPIELIINTLYTERYACIY